MKRLLTLTISTFFTLSLILGALSIPQKNNEKLLLAQDEDPNIIIIGLTDFTV